VSTHRNLTLLAVRNRCAPLTRKPDLTEKVTIEPLADADSDLFFQTMEQLEQVLRAGDLESCEKTVVERIGQLPRSRLDLSIEADISNDPADAAKVF